MKKKSDKRSTTGKKIEFWVTKLEKKQILKNMESNGMSNLSSYLKILALSGAKITFNVEIPSVLNVSEARLGESGVVEGRDDKRAAG